MDNQTGNTSIFDGQKEALPNATAVLVLGIISIVSCWCYGLIGIICGIIALVIGSKDMARYRLQPDKYIPSSYKNLKAGRVCAIIGLSLSAIYFVLIIVVIAVIGISGLTHMDEVLRQYQGF